MRREGFSARSLIALVSSAIVPSIDSESTSKCNEVVFACGTMGVMYTVSSPLEVSDGVTFVPFTGLEGHARTDMYEREPFRDAVSGWLWL
jgi:hypothetical protein